MVRWWIPAPPVLIFSGFSVNEINEIKLNSSTFSGHDITFFHLKIFVSVLLPWKHDKCGWMGNVA
jgi:hypothetical protein